MKKKFLYVVLIGLAFLFTSTICFASENVEATDLGNEITSSIKETEKSVANVITTNADSAKDDAEDVKNTIKDGAENVRKCY